MSDEGGNAVSDQPSEVGVRLAAVRIGVETIERADVRACAVDGPVPPTEDMLSKEDVATICQSIIAADIQIATERARHDAELTTLREQLKEADDQAEVATLGLEEKAKEITTLRERVRVLEEYFDCRSEQTETPCTRCGEPCIEFTIPNETWNAVIRTDGHERGDEYLCYSCWLEAVYQRVKSLLSPSSPSPDWQAIAGELAEVISDALKCNPSSPGLCAICERRMQAALSRYSAATIGIDAANSKSIGEGPVEDCPPDAHGSTAEHNACPRCGGIGSVGCSAAVGEEGKDATA